MNLKRSMKTYSKGTGIVPCLVPQSLVGSLLGDFVVLQLSVGTRQLQKGFRRLNNISSRIQHIGNGYLHKVDRLLHIGTQTQCRGQLKHIGTDQTHKSHTLPNSKGILHIGDPTLSHKCWSLLGDLTRRLLSVPTGVQQRDLVSPTPNCLLIEKRILAGVGPNTRLYNSRKNPGFNLHNNVHTLVCQTK